MSIIVCDRNVIMQASPIHKHAKKICDKRFIIVFVHNYVLILYSKKKKKKKNHPILIEEYPRNVGSISKNDFFSSSRFWIHLKSIGFVLISIQVSVSDMSLPTW